MADLGIRPKGLVVLDRDAYASVFDLTRFLWGNENTQQGRKVNRDLRIKEEMLSPVRRTGAHTLLLLGAFRLAERLNFDEWIHRRAVQIRHHHQILKKFTLFRLG